MSWDKPTPIGKADVDWSKTRAWGDGGYYGRLFMNVRGREPQGTIDPSDYEAKRDQAKAALDAAIATVIDAYAGFNLPRHWGSGRSASADGGPLAFRTTTNVPSCVREVVRGSHDADRNPFV